MKSPLGGRFGWLADIWAAIEKRARRASFALDLKIILQTIAVILQIALGRRDFGDPEAYLREKLREF